ncbi:MAG TPA: hypothetical protein VGI22_06200 [Xanthobacteraceae bacterium]|jgi:hypothetical protein
MAKILLLRLPDQPPAGLGSRIRRWSTEQFRAFAQALRRWAIDAEFLTAMGLLATALVIGLATIGDYGITVDEFNADDYGPKSLAWYTSGFADRSSFETVEDTLWYYGPWFQMLTAFVQSLAIADPWTVRHTMTFLIGLAGLAAVVPIGRLAAGRWAGLLALGLCLTTGYVYGGLFFTPIDIPFLFAMMLATLAIIVMARRVVPSWPATLGAGILTGLAIATRSSGLITQVYLLAASGLCGIEALARPGGAVRSDLARIGARAVGALAIGWMVAFALWPWLQIGNPLTQFKLAFLLFANHPNSFEFPFWGQRVWTTALPWTYVPGQLLARLPEAFLLLLLAGILFGLAAAFGFARGTVAAVMQRKAAGVKELALHLARARCHLMVWAAVILPVGFIIARHSTLYDGVRHVLFVIPMLAVIAATGFLRLRPLWRRAPVPSAALGGAYVGISIWTLAVLHPLEYVDANALVGGVAGAYGRFDLDYWAAAATVALRRLESRLDHEQPERFAEEPPSLMVCMSFREAQVAPLFRRPWRLETDPAKADFIIATERWHCADDIGDAALIDEVERFGRPFAWIYTRARPPVGSAVSRAASPGEGTDGVE